VLSIFAFAVTALFAFGGVRAFNISGRQWCVWRAAMKNKQMQERLTGILSSL